MNSLELLIYLDKEIYKYSYHIKQKINNMIKQMKNLHTTL